MNFEQAKQRLKPLIESLGFTVEGFYPSFAYDMQIEISGGYIPQGKRAVMAMPRRFWETIDAEELAKRTKANG